MHLPINKRTASRGRGGFECAADASAELRFERVRRVESADPAGSGRATIHVAVFTDRKKGETGLFIRGLDGNPGRHVNKTGEAQRSARPLACSFGVIRQRLRSPEIREDI